MLGQNGFYQVVTREASLQQESMKSIGSQSILTNSGISTGGHRGFGGGFGGFGGGHGGFGGGRGFGGKKTYSLLS